jgi:hypothetical protein
MVYERQDYALNYNPACLLSILSLIRTNDQADYWVLLGRRSSPYSERSSAAGSTRLARSAGAQGGR